MIELITGLPGNCKTLYTIAYVRDWAKRDNRPVFYSGIPELTIPDWSEIEPEKWMDCPPRSIVIVDECQRVFRNRSLGQIPGRHVTELETHRHLGIDLVFITQHPSLIDPAIRKLTGLHKHMIRIWGFEASTIHKWDAVRDSPDKPATRKDSEQSKWKFDKSVYGLYKSAEAHTVKKGIPARVKMLLLVPLAIAAAGYAVYSMTLGKHKPPAPAAGLAVPGSAPMSAKVPGQVSDKVNPLQDAREYMFKQAPRLESVAYTAPKYDQLTQPTSVPVPAACVYSKSQNRCACFTQQATPMPVPLNVCLEVAHNGFFQEFNPDGNKGGASSAKAVRVLDESQGLPASGASTRNVRHVDAPSAPSIRGGKPGEGFSARDGVRAPYDMAG